MSIHSPNHMIKYTQWSQQKIKVNQQQIGIGSAGPWDWNGKHGDLTRQKLHFNLEVETCKELPIPSSSKQSRYSPIDEGVQHILISLFIYLFFDLLVLLCVYFF